MASQARFESQISSSPFGGFSSMSQHLSTQDSVPSQPHFRIISSGSPQPQLYNPEAVFLAPGTSEMATVVCPTSFVSAYIHIYIRTVSFNVHDLIVRVSTCHHKSSRWRLLRRWPHRKPSRRRPHRRPRRRRPCHKNSGTAFIAIVKLLSEGGVQVNLCQHFHRNHILVTRQKKPRNAH